MTPRCLVRVAIRPAPQERCNGKKTNRNDSSASRNIAFSSNYTHAGEKPNSECWGAVIRQKTEGQVIGKIFCTCIINKTCAPNRFLVSQCETAKSYSRLFWTLLPALVITPTKTDINQREMTSSSSVSQNPDTLHEKIYLPITNTYSIRAIGCTLPSVKY